MRRTRTFNSFGTNFRSQGGCSEARRSPPGHFQKCGYHNYTFGSIYIVYNYIYNKRADVPRASDKVGERYYIAVVGPHVTAVLRVRCLVRPLSLSRRCVSGGANRRQPHRAAPRLRLYDCLRVAAFDMLSALNTGGTTTFSDASAGPLYHAP
jgi:hypothetical protein